MPVTQHSPHGSVRAEFPHTARFLRMQLQPEFPQAFLKLSHEPLGVFAVLKADHQIISVADHHHLPARNLLSPGFYPKVENIMQIHVGEPWRKYSPYAKDNFCFDRV